MSWRESPFFQFGEVDPLTFLLTLPFQLLNVLFTVLPPPFPQAVASATQPKTTYSNLETWEISEDEATGKITMKIKRKAEKG